jgi:16S rRNA (uracil1498-N3)-methyltransferase
VLRGEEAHHLSRVLRVEAGQQFEISDGASAYLAEISGVSKSEVRFRVLESLGGGAPLPPITLYVALIKFDRFEWMVEKATEIGVARIVPVEAARTENGLFAAAGKRVERWRKIARESSQQSRRVAAPVVDEARKVTGLAAEGCRLRMEEQPGAKMLLAALPVTREPVSLLIGPEGGWTDAEREKLDGAGWVAASLGTAILRAETAAIVAAGVAAQRWWLNWKMPDADDAHGNETHNPRTDDDDSTYPGAGGPLF